MVLARGSGRVGEALLQEGGLHLDEVLARDLISSGPAFGAAKKIPGEECGVELTKVGKGVTQTAFEILAHGGGELGLDGASEYVHAAVRSVEQVETGID